MSVSKFSARSLALSGVIAALYAALSLVSTAMGLGFGTVQLRLSEALCVLPILFPEAVPGLAVGCLVTNLLSPYGAADLIFGTLATLLAAVLTRRIRRRALAPLPTILCNAVIVGALLGYVGAQEGGVFWTLFALNAFTVGLGELIASAVLGQLLLGVLPRVRFFREMIPADRLSRLGLSPAVGSGS